MFERHATVPETVAPSSESCRLCLDRFAKAGVSAVPSRTSRAPCVQVLDQGNRFAGRKVDIVIGADRRKGRIQILRANIGFQQRHHVRIAGAATHS